MRRARPRFRGCLLALALAALAPQAHAACATSPTEPGFTACLHRQDGWPRYGHDVLGDTPEWSTLRIARGGKITDISHPGHIFEDVIPRFDDITGDGQPEVWLVQSSYTEGARVVVYDPNAPGAPIAATPYIGQANRWLAPVGVADLNGDGSPELAYVDRPHLRRTLRIWQFRKGALHEIATLDGVTNHRIGDPEIGGGIRPCTGTPEMIVASADWRRVLAIRLVGNRLMQKDIGPYIGRESLAAALMCRHQG
ncbi:FG-GAP repeat domain-containing protein [Arenibacterium halophilum]|uniref:FG-GAP repeat domain-containing protein n=1 Tax=Arenibacterium halophilum TaxID=2583821 RepID=UPI001FE66D8D|nr:VCBS repeat-containing protein [Arenibacterium halophilum]